MEFDGTEYNPEHFESPGPAAAERYLEQKEADGLKGAYFNDVALAFIVGLCVGMALMAGIIFGLGRLLT